MAVCLAMVAAGGMTGCQTLNKNKNAVASAENSEQGYYQDAMKELDKGHYTQASEALTNLRVFYPTGRYAEQALLDLMYVQFEAGEYENAIASAEQFIRLYPRNPQVSYAYYVRGVANMQGSSGGLNFVRLNQAQRDVSYLKVAFANFQELITKYPNSPYAADAAQRMLYIYNQIAEHELTIAKWYIKREAYVAAANRARWVFQYFPQSESTPEAIAILAYTNQKLGLTDLAQRYKTLLQINYPQWLNAQGQVKLSEARGNHHLLNKLTFGKLGRADDRPVVAESDYQGATKTQVIERAGSIRLPNVTLNQAPKSNETAGRSRKGINLGLGLPDESRNDAMGQSGNMGNARRSAWEVPSSVEPQQISNIRLNKPSDDVSSDAEEN